MDDDLAVQLDVLVEHLVGEAADDLADVITERAAAKQAANSAAEFAGQVAGLRRQLAGDVRVPLSWVCAVISSWLPVTAILPRLIDMPISALEKAADRILSWPAIVRGAPTSRLRWMALSAIATGAIT